MHLGKHCSNIFQKIVENLLQTKIDTYKENAALLSYTSCQIKIRGGKIHIA